MLAKPLLAALLAVAPSGAQAFASMDCIGTEVCTAEACAPSATVFAIAFDWPAEAASLTMAGDPPLRLAMANNETDTDGGIGALSYVNDAAGAGLLLSFDPRGITMTFFSGGGTRYRATCAAREAA